MSRAGVWCLQVRCRRWGGLDRRQHLWGSPGPCEKARSTSGTLVLLGPLPAGLVGEALPRHRRQPAVPSVFVQVELGGGFGPQSASQNPLRRAGLLTPTRSPICTSHSTLGGRRREAPGGSGGAPQPPRGAVCGTHAGGRVSAGIPPMASPAPILAQARHPWPCRALLVCDSEMRLHTIIKLDSRTIIGSQNSPFTRCSRRRRILGQSHNRSVASSSAFLWMTSSVKPTCSLSSSYIAFTSKTYKLIELYLAAIK